MDAIGCGNSSLGNDLSANGYTYVLNSDYSDVLIGKMNQEYPNLKWVVADINKLEEFFSFESFDVILEKATLDSFFVKEKDPWHYNSEILIKMNRILSQISRILVKGGKFISLSFTQPHFRKPIYAKPEFNWSFNYSTYGDYFHYFFYVMTKGESLDSACINASISISHFVEPLSEDEEDFIFSIQCP
ncbi:EEF1A lysine methyltransferase 4-like isoform X2 [Artemia franciscana]|uniref:EEF1A lysine methyltransferase 4-like isoform X2 n=1 Tax=Artemia franciscana TaxID=6661 RepID=UPI0032D9DCF3